MRKDCLFAMIWTVFLLWPSTQGGSEIITPYNKPPLEKRLDALYQEIEKEIGIAQRQQDSLNLIK